MVDIIRETENDDSEACESNLQIGYLSSRNGVKWAFHLKSSKMSFLC